MSRYFSIFFLLLSLGLQAQIIDYKNPIGWEENEKQAIPTFTFPLLDHEKLLAEDKIEAQNKEIPMRFAIAFPVAIDLIIEGLSYYDKYGNSHKLIKLNVPGSYGVGIIFSRFSIPEKGEVYIYNQNKSMLLGAITSKNNNPYKVLSTTPIQGSVIYIEYIEPANTSFNTELTIGTVTHVYRDYLNHNKSFGESGSCNINVACDAGAGWENQVRSVAMIVTNNGTRWCTGTLINNTQNNGIPYFLTANHCIDTPFDNPATWSFIFNYKSPVCTPSENGLLSNSVFGAELIANNSENDFALLALNTTPPENFNVYYSGWTRDIENVDNATGIHHPLGDVMKISRDFDPPALSGYLGASGDGYWRVIDWDEGTTESGSSGSALFSNNNKIIGQLRGGQATCGNNSSDYYGALYQSWDGISNETRLKDWLDPTNLDVLSLDGYDPLIDGIEENELLNSIKLYPVPASESINLNFSKTIMVDDIRFYDVQGRLVKLFHFGKKLIGNVSLPITDLNSGFYHLSIQSIDVNLNFKLVVE